MRPCGPHLLLEPLLGRLQLLRGRAHWRLQRAVRDAASRRADPHHDIVRLLEDNASSAVTLTPGVEEIEAVLAKREPSGDPVDPVQAKADAVGRIAFRALVPLVSSRLVDRLDQIETS